ncbi:unnamed protein product [Brassica rapa subsp. narinosa]
MFGSRSLQQQYGSFLTHLFQLHFDTDFKTYHGFASPKLLFLGSKTWLGRILQQSYRLVYEAGLSICSIDPSPKLIWSNEYGVWVHEFEAKDANSTVVCSVQVDIDHMLYTWI